MEPSKIGKKKRDGPKRRQRHYSYDENVNEAARLIDDEPVEIEQDRPAEENRPEERVEPEDKSITAAFEE